MKKIVVLGVAVLLSLATAACGSSSSGSGSSGSSSGSKDPIEVGAILSLSGAVSAFGLLTQQGVDLAVTDVNAHGGVNGRQLGVKYFDDTSRPERAVALAQQVVSDKNIVAVIGGTAAATGPALTPVLNKGGVPTITLYGDPKQTTSPGEFIFHTAAAYDQHADAILKYVHDELKKTKLGVEYQGNQYGQDVSAAISSLASKYGIQIVASQSIDPNTTDATPIVQKVLGANPEVMVSVNTTNVAPVIAAWKSSGTSVPLVETIASSVSANLSAADHAATGLPVLAYFNGQTTLARQKDAAAAYLTKNGKPAQYNVATGWDAVHIMAKAMASADPTRKSVTAGLNGINGYQGAAGIISFSASDHEGFDDSGWIWLTYQGNGNYKFDPLWAAANNVPTS